MTHSSSSPHHHLILIFLSFISGVFPSLISCLSSGLKLTESQAILVRNTEVEVSNAGTTPRHLDQLEYLKYLDKLIS